MQLLMPDPRWQRVHSASTYQRSPVPHVQEAPPVQCLHGLSKTGIHTHGAPVPAPILSPTIATLAQIPHHMRENLRALH